MPTIRCRSGLKNGRCPAYLGTRVNQAGDPEPVWVDRYNYKALQRRIREIKLKYASERQVILMADRAIPYQAVVRAMDTLRGKPSSSCTGKDDCLFDQVILSAGVD